LVKSRFLQAHPLAAKVPKTSGGDPGDFGKNMVEKCGKDRKSLIFMELVMRKSCRKL